MFKKKTYHTPLGKTADKEMLNLFTEDAIDIKTNGEILIQHRLIPYEHLKQGGIWFEFAVICQIPRSKLDYLELANQFDEFYIANIPKLKEEDTVAVLLLIMLIDVLYDMRKRIVISAATSLHNLYEQGSLVSGFARTLSRLEEMQSVDYG